MFYIIYGSKNDVGLLSVNEKIVAVSGKRFLHNDGRNFRKVMTAGFWIEAYNHLDVVLR